jgi:ureidoglycolate lyase
MPSRIRPLLIVPTLRVVIQRMTLRVTLDAERPWRHYHAERGNDQPCAH